MKAFEIFKDIGERNNGDVYLGVVGPVRVGKSTFIKKFMEVAVIPNIVDEEDKKRALDELPQSGSGKTIMTMEPKFVPSQAITLNIDESLFVKVRLIDCVGFVIEPAIGYLEDQKMRMVKTPWFEDTIPFDEAAKIGTQKVIKEHSTLGIVIFCDETITEFKREDYIKAEDAIIEEMKSIKRPYIIILNSKTPNSKKTLALKEEIKNKYGANVIPLNVEKLTDKDAQYILKEALYEYPVSMIDVALPKWVSALDEKHYIKESISNNIQEVMNECSIVRDIDKICEKLKDNEYLTNVSINSVNTSTGVITMVLEVKDELYQKVLKELVGCEISDRAELMKVLTEFVKAKKDYDIIGQALEMANQTGYGYTNANLDYIKIEKPSVLKVGNRYGIKVKANAPTYHIIKVDLETSFEPILGNKMQSEYFVKNLTEAFDNNPLLVLDCEIFGQKFGEILRSGVTSKLSSMPDPLKIKFQQLLKTITNKGKENMIAFVF